MECREIGLGIPTEEEKKRKKKKVGCDYGRAV
jgi:hypothetical protein